MATPTTLRSYSCDRSFNQLGGTVYGKIGYHASYEQFKPSALMKYAQAAEQAGYTTGLSRSRTIAANPGHCLWSGIVSPERAARVVMYHRHGQVGLYSNCCKLCLAYKRMPLTKVYS